MNLIAPPTELLPCGFALTCVKTIPKVRIRPAAHRIQSRVGFFPSLAAHSSHTAISTVLPDLSRFSFRPFFWGSGYARGAAPAALLLKPKAPAQVLSWPQTQHVPCLLYSVSI